MRDQLHEENEALHEVWLPLHEAAQYLHISPRAVQLRVEKGKIKRDRQQGRVVFCVPRQAGEQTELHEEDESIHVESEVENEPVHEVTAQSNAVYMAHLEAEVEFLRSQVAAHQQNESELRRLMLSDKIELQELRQKVALLAAPPVEDEPTVQDIQERPSAPHTTQELTKMEERTPEEIQGVDKPLSWWHRLMRWRG